MPSLPDNIITKEDADALTREISDSAQNSYKKGHRPGDSAIKRENLADLPVLSMTLAFTPSRDFLTDIIKGLREQYENNLILDILVDENIIGGAVVTYKGQYRDYSLRKRLEENII